MAKRYGEEPAGPRPVVLRRNSAPARLTSGFGSQPNGRTAAASSKKPPGYEHGH